MPPFLRCVSCGFLQAWFEANTLLKNLQEKIPPVLRDQVSPKITLLFFSQDAGNKKQEIKVPVKDSGKNLG
jgi:hypothetical protein